MTLPCERNKKALVRHMGWTVNRHSVILKDGYVQRTPQRLMLRWPSLDALAEIEKTLEGRWSMYWLELKDIVAPGGSDCEVELTTAMLQASFDQRAEALCKTLRLESA